MLKQLAHYYYYKQYEEFGLETNNKAVLEDVGQNADLYIANQEDNTQNQAPGQR